MQSSTSENLVILFYVNSIQKKAFQAHTTVPLEVSSILASADLFFKVIFLLSPVLKSSLPTVISSEQHLKCTGNKYHLEEQLMDDLTGSLSDVFDSVGLRQMSDFL